MSTLYSRLALSSTALAAAVALVSCGSAGSSNESDASASASPPAASSTGQSTQSSSEPTASSGSRATQSSATPAAPSSSVSKSLSARGAIVKGPGDTAAVATVMGDKLISFTFNSIEVDPACTSPYAETAENGHLVAVDVDLEVFPGAGESFLDGDLLQAHNFRFIDEDGSTFNGDLGTMASYSCFPEDKVLNTEIGDGERSKGLLVLDVPASTGTLLLEDPASGHKWEWAL